MKKYNNKTLPALIKLTQKYFNEFIRLRDSDEHGNFTCISCGEFKGKGQLQAGHYFPVGQNNALRFDERNCSGECLRDNFYSGDHLIGYRENLIKKIGQESFDNLCRDQKQFKRGLHKWDRYSLIEKIEKYKTKCKELRKNKE